MSSRILFSQRLFIAALLAGIVPPGCAEKKQIVSTEMVEGIVTLDGTPVPGAVVTFTPAQANAGAPATGMSDAQGKYTITAAGLGEGKSAASGAGTLPGEYLVGVVKDESPKIPGSNDPDYKMPEPGKTPPAPTVTHVVPQQFNDPQTSGIKVTVQAGKNDIPIKLTTK